MPRAENQNHEADKRYCWPADYLRAEGPPVETDCVLGEFVFGHSVPPRKEVRMRALGHFGFLSTIHELTAA